MKRVNVKVVHYALGLPGVSIDVEQEGEIDGAWVTIAPRETVETRQGKGEPLGEKWTDSHIIAAVEAAMVEVTPAQDAVAAVRDEKNKIVTAAIPARDAVTAKRFDGMTVVAE